MFSSHRGIESKREIKSNPSHISTVRPQADDAFGILMPTPFGFLDVALGILELFVVNGAH